MVLKNIVILTGAGISAESGVATFRDAGGIWAKYDLHEVATPEAFAATPELVHEFYNLRRRVAKDASPNAAHFALGKLDKVYGQISQKAVDSDGPSLTVISQNVDDLHKRAGSTSLLAMHGSLMHVRCIHCSAVIAWDGDVFIETACPDCSKTGSLRPDIVWFGEMPKFLDEIEQVMAKADIFVSIGTSGSVYPAASLVGQARARSIETLELNLEPSDNHYMFDRGIYGPATEVVSDWVSDILAGSDMILPD